MFNHLLASFSAIALAVAPLPSFVLSASQIAQQEASPPPNQNNLSKRMEAPTYVAGTMLGGQLVGEHIWNNTLVAKAIVAIGSFHRDGFLVPGDGGGANYTPQSGVCPLNGGAGDGGSQLPMLDGCAYLDWASVGNVAPLPVFGAMCKGDGGAIAADTAGLQAAVATGHDVYIPTNNYCIVNRPTILPNLGQRMHGDGPQASKILSYTPWGGTPGTITASLNRNTLGVTNVPSGVSIGKYTVIADSGAQGANGLGNSTYITAVNASNPPTCSAFSPCTYTVSGSGSYTVGTSTSTTVASETMNVAPLGVITLSQTAQEVRGLDVSFSQPQSPSNRGGITTYPAAIMARQAAMVLDDLLLVGCTTGIDAGGNANTGNSYLSNIDTGCYDYGIRFDGAVDAVRIRAHHSFPFQMTGQQQAVFFRTTAPSIAIDLGRLDDFAISDSLSIGQIGINFYTGAQGGAFGSVVNHDFDGDIDGILMQTPNASVTISASGFTSGAASQHGIVQTAGKIIATGVGFFAAVPTESILFTGGTLSISGSQFDQLNNDAAAIIANCSGNANPRGFGLASTPCMLTLIGNQVQRDTATAFSNPWLSSQGNEIVVGSSNSVTPTTAKINGSTTPPAVSIANDTLGNRWIGNSSPGWNNFVSSAAMPNGLTAPDGGGKYFGN